MSKTGTIGVFNNTSRIITLKAQTTKRSAKRDAKRFKYPLQPGVLNFVPEAYWALFKKNKVVDGYIQQEMIMVGRKANKIEKEVVVTSEEKQQLAETAKQNAIINEIETANAEEAAK